MSAKEMRFTYMKEYGNIRLAIIMLRWDYGWY